MIAHKYGASRLIKTVNKIKWQARAFGKWQTLREELLANKQGVIELVNKWNHWAGKYKSIDPFTLKPVYPNPVRLAIRKIVYRGKPGYLVYGSYNGYTGQKLFFTREIQAREFIRRIQAREEPSKILQDIWGIKNPILPEIGAGIVAGLGLGVGFKAIDIAHERFKKKKK